MACPGSVAYAAQFANRSSSFANEGTAAHELASKCLNEDRDAIDFLGWLINVRPAPGRTPFDPPERTLEPANGETTFEVGQEMADAVQIYLDEVRALRDSSTTSMMSVEERLDMTDLHPGIFGTGDATIYDCDACWLHVVDLKYGKGLAVEAENNPQLFLYGAGAARRHHNLPLRGITLHIIQPRAPHPKGPVRSHEIDLLDLLEFEETIRAAALATEAFDAPLHAGEHCRFCPAAGVCAENRRHALALADLEFAEDGEIAMPAPDAMTPEHRAKVLRAADAILNWTKAVQQHEHDAALAGNPPAGFKLVAKRASRRWREGDDVLDHLTIDLGLSEDDVFDRKMRSPAQLEKHFPGKNKKERETAMAALVTKESSGTNLVPEGDPRPAVKVDAAAEFGE